MKVWCDNMIGTMKIYPAMPYNGQRSSEAMAIICGQWAMHRSVWCNLGCYRVSHVGSGMCIISHSPLNDALRLCRMLDAATGNMPSGIGPAPLFSTNEQFKKFESVYTDVWRKWKTAVGHSGHCKMDLCVR